MARLLEDLRRQHLAPHHPHDLAPPPSSTAVEFILSAGFFDVLGMTVFMKSADDFWVPWH